MRCHLWLLGGLLLVACASRSPQATLPLRGDVTLLDVRLVAKVGYGDSALADDQPKEVKTSDTILVYPVVRVLDGEARRETLYLSNTTHVRRVGSDPDTTRPGWPIHRRIDIWNKLKSDIRIEWFEITPSGTCYPRGAAIHYFLKPLTGRGWSQELTGTPGTRRLAVEVHYGSQVVRSCQPVSEAVVAGSPWLSFRPDTTAGGWAANTIGGLPCREGSWPEQTFARTSCDSRSLVAYALSHIGYHFDSLNTETMDSMGELVFSGYVRMGRLYDLQGRPARLKLGTDVQQSDVIHFLTSHCYGIVARDSAVPGVSYGGLPARLPVLSACDASPQIMTLGSLLMAHRFLLAAYFGKSEIAIRRYPRIPPPPPPTRVPHRVRPVPRPPATATPLVHAKAPAHTSKSAKSAALKPGAKP